MLHSTIVASEAAAGDTSTRTTRHRDVQVIPHGSYNFGDAEMLPGRCIGIEPKPVKNVIAVHQAAVAPGSLAGSALPRATAILPTGEMRGLGEPLAPVPQAFRHGAPYSKTATIGNREVRRVGRSLMPMAAHAPDYERNPFGKDATPNRSASTSAVIPNYSLAPDDKLRRKLIQPVQPTQAMTVAPMSAKNQPSVVYQPTTYTGTEARREPGVVHRPAPLVTRAVLHDVDPQDAANVFGYSIGAIGLAVLAAGAGLYWYFNRSE